MAFGHTFPSESNALSERSESKGMYYVYILRLPRGRLYVGHTTDLKKRIATHAKGKGAVLTRRHPRLELAYHEEHLTLLSARRREKQLKNWSHAKKEALARGDLKALNRLAKSRQRKMG
jgi:putative endonuclease